MPKNETELIKLTKNQENLKKFLRYGDKNRLADMTGFSLKTVYQALNAKIRKDEIWNALAQIVRERRKADAELDKNIEYAIS